LAKKAARGGKPASETDRVMNRDQRRTLAPEARPIVDVLQLVALAANPGRDGKGAQGGRRVRGR